MENASKALMIAGSVLLTIVVFGMLIYFIGQLREIPNAQDEAKKIEQIEKFNAEYESYDKEEMYGVDVATIFNKVINNNKKYADPITGRYEVNADNHYINIEITLLDKIESSAERYYEDEVLGQVSMDPYENQKIKGKINGKGNPVDFKLGQVFPANSKISLIKEHNGFMNQDETIENFFSGSKISETYKIQLTYPKADKFDEKNYTLVYSGFRNFKRKLFKCVGIEYNSETSRVSCIKFEEIPRDEEE